MFDPNASLTTPESELDGINELQVRGFGWFLMRWLADQSSRGRACIFPVTCGRRPKLHTRNYERRTRDGITLARAALRLRGHTCDR